MVGTMTEANRAHIRRLAATQTAPLPGTAGSGTRVAVLVSALRLFAERGFAGTSVRDIANDLGLKAATLYSHFASKAHILAELVKLGHDEQLRAVRAELLASNPDPRDQITAYVRGHVTTHATYPMLCIVANAELHMLPPELAQPVFEQRRYSEQLISDITQRGIDLGAFDVPDVWLATAAIGGMGLRVAYWYTPESDHSISTLADVYGQFALRILGAEHPTNAPQQIS